MTKQNWKNKLNARILSVPIIALAFIVYGFTTNTSNAKVGEERNPLWVDMVTPNVEATKNFYAALLGWNFLDKSKGGLKNYLIENNGQVIGSIIEISKAKSAAWIPAANVPSSSMKDKTKALQQKGAKIAIAALNLPGRGNQVMFEGPQGEEFSLISDNSFHNNSVYRKANGNLMGTEFWADDVNQAQSFYEYAFGVSVEEEDFDGMPYWFFTKDDMKLAGMIKNPVENQSSQWVSYFFVDDLKSAVMKAQKLGAYIVMEPNSKVRDGKIAIVQDPNDALICLYENH